MAGNNTYLESDGKSVTVTLTSTVGKDQVAYAEGWLGVTAGSGDSGDNVALTVDQREYQWMVPTTLNVSKGDIVYVDVTDLTGHIPDDSAYYTASGSDRRALFRATADKASNDMVTGIMLMGV